MSPMGARARVVAMRTSTPSSPTVSFASVLTRPRRLRSRSFAVRTARIAAWVAAVVALAATAGAQSLSVGLSAVGAQRIGNGNLIGSFASPAGDHFAFALATGDFNGDGVDDLATGMPYADGLADAPIVDSGSVVVRYGVSGEGLPPNQAGTVLRQTPAVNPAEEGDLFGFALASCDFNGDGFDDLAVGVPNEDHVGREDTGGVQIHYGGPDGLPTTGWTFYAQSTPGMPGDAEDYDYFGENLACGDFDADTFADLVIGVPEEKIGLFRTHAGMIDIVPGTALGLDASAATYLSQEVDGMGGDAEIQDYFGRALAVGDFNDDGFEDLAIGSPGEDHFTGAIHMVFGGPSGLSTAGSLFLMETFLGGSSEEWDDFGRQLTSADFDHDGFDDLVIGISGEDLGPGGSAAETGRVCVLYGSPAGYDPSRTQFWSEDVIWGSPAANESGVYFGLTLATGDFDKDGFADLAAGRPGLYLDPGHKDGAFTVLMGSSDGLSNARRRGIAAGSEGFPGDPTQHEESFALSFASGDFDGDGHADLAVGSPHEDEGGLVDAGAETLTYGALFADGLETGNTAIWTETAGTVGGNRVRAAAAALGPKTSRFGLVVSLLNPSRGIPSTPAFVHVGSEVGFRDEATLKGSFFVDPQGVQMSAVPGANSALFEMITFTDGPARGNTTQLAFNLNRDDAAGGWVIIATFFNANVGGLQFASGTVLGPLNDPNGHNYRIEFEWKAATSPSVPGRLTIWKTRFIDRAPDAAGRVLVGSVDLPGTVRAVINDVFVGMISGQDPGTSGTLLIDELSFRR